MYSQTVPEKVDMQSAMPIANAFPTSYIRNAQVRLTKLIHTETALPVDRRSLSLNLSCGETVPQV